jgi:hypothetical protein
MIEVEELLLRSYKAVLRVRPPDRGGAHGYLILPARLTRRRSRRRATLTPTMLYGN